jgi:hypothetical protein
VLLMAGFRGTGNEPARVSIQGSECTWFVLGSQYVLFGGGVLVRFYPCGPFFDYG